jgi:hypothetical protein
MVVFIKQNSQEFKISRAGAELGEVASTAQGQAFDHHMPALQGASQLSHVHQDKDLEEGSRVDTRCGQD